jgi:hypothetical protein
VSYALQTHFDLLDIVRTDLSQLGFPREAYKALHDHESKLKSQHSDDPRWFNAAANYLSVTKQALQCKLEACSYMMRQEESGGLQTKAVKLLLNPSDAMALGHGIAVVMKEGLQERYTDELEAVSASSHLHELSLDLKGAGLEGPYLVCTASLLASCNNTCSGEVPDVLVRICSKATFFDLSENKFEFPSEAGGGRTYLRQVVELERNMQKVTEVDLRNQQDLIGKCKYGWMARACMV